MCVGACACLQVRLCSDSLSAIRCTATGSFCKIEVVISIFEF